MMKTCETCYYRRHFDVDESQTYFVCKRFPPQVYTQPEGEYKVIAFAIQPQIDETDWCGEWKERDHDES
jgi:hypothetical protein